MTGLKIGFGMWNSFIPGVRHDFADVSTLQLDLDPDVLTAGVVGTFANSGPAGGTFTAAGGVRPTCVAAGLNGHNGLSFDGTDDTMASTLTGANILDADGYVFFAVVTIDAINTDSAAAYDNDAVISVGSEYVGMHLRSTPSFEAYHWDGAEKKSVVTVATGSPLLLQQRYDGSKIYGRVGSAAEAAGTTAGSVADLTGTLQLGRDDGTSYFDGTLWRLLAFDSSLSAADIILVRARLAGLYGVAV